MKGIYLYDRRYCISLYTDRNIPIKWENTGDRYLPDVYKGEGNSVLVWTMEGLVLDRKPRVLSVVTERSQKNEHRIRSINTYGGLEDEEFQSKNREVLMVIWEIEGMK